MTTTSTVVPDRSGRLEGLVEVVILLAVAAMAGAASFTHVHDWTMDNSPAGTSDWFGWANAMVSELIPLAAGLEARRRHRRYGHAGLYPIALIIGAVALSLTGQFSQAEPTLSGWLVAAVPALGFIALVKLVISRPTSPTTTPTTVDNEHPTPTTTLTTEPHPPTTASRHDGGLQKDTEPPATVPAGSGSVPTHLLPTVRFAVTNHHATTGRPITPAELATRMSINPDLAGQLLTLVNPPEPATPARLNGATIRSGA
ncbi:MAG TPA: hypothetical protein VFM55_26880 [Micromonosporaceae bacterium]|nr:hypothetical protein [Micromonosporaceae bacterium]